MTKSYHEVMAEFRAVTRDIQNYANERLFNFQRDNGVTALFVKAKPIVVKAPVDVTEQVIAGVAFGGVITTCQTLEQQDALMDKIDGYPY